MTRAACIILIAASLIGCAYGDNSHAEVHVVKFEPKAPAVQADVKALKQNNPEQSP